MRPALWALRWKIVWRYSLGSMRVAAVWIAKQFWRWSVVGFASGTLYGCGVAAMYAGQEQIAILLYFIAIAWITSKALTWEEARNHKERRFISLFTLAIGVLGIVVSYGWVKHTEPSVMVPQISIPARLVPAPPDSELMAKIDQVIALLNRNAETSKTTSDLSLPGVSYHMLINLHHPASSVRQYVLDYGTAGGPRISVYISPEDSLTFSVIDSKLELYDVRALIDKEQVPLDRIIWLSCQLGFTGTTTQMSISVDGQRLAYRELPSRIAVSDAPGGRVGGDVTDTYFGTFVMYSLMIYSRTLTVPEMRQDAFYSAKLHTGIQYTTRNFKQPVQPVVR